MSKLPGVLTAVLLLGSVPVVLASFDTSLEEYRNNYNLYRDTLAEFQLSREDYLKWGTLSARDQLAISSQNFLVRVTEFLTSYFRLLYVTIEEQSGFEPGVRGLVVTVVDGYLEDYSSLAGRAARTEDLTALEDLFLDVDSEYSEGKMDAEFVQVSISLAKLSEVRRKTEAFADEIRGMVEEDKSYPERDRILESWLTKITKKLASSEDIQAELWAEVLQFPELGRDYQKQRLLREVLKDGAESQTLVLQVVDHLLEILRKVKY